MSEEGKLAPPITAPITALPANAPPAETHGAQGAVYDPSGQRPPAFERAPSIVTSSPGASTASATVPHAPTLPTYEPQAMAAMLARMANEMFGAPVVDPSMSPTSAVTAAGQGASPAGAGYAPMGTSGLAPPFGLSTPEAGITTAPMTTALHATGFEPELAPLGIDTRRLFAPAEPIGFDTDLAHGIAPPGPHVGAGVSPPGRPDPIGPHAGVGVSPPGAPAPIDPPPIPQETNPWLREPAFDHLDAPARDSLFHSEPLAAHGRSGHHDDRAGAVSPHDREPTTAASEFDTRPTNPFAQPTDFDAALTNPFAQPVVDAAPAAPASPLGPSSIPTSAPANPGGGTAIPTGSVPAPDTASPPTSPIAPTGGNLAAPQPPHNAPELPDAPSGLWSGFAPATHALLDAPSPPSTQARSAPVTPPPQRPDGASVKPFDPYLVRKDFPILDERVHDGKRLVWLDNGATTQKPRAVIDRLTHFYEHENSNIHRAAHTLAARATDAYETARETTRRFLNAPSAAEIVFVRGTTEGINLLAKAWGDQHVHAGDEIVITHLEHHANIVPWQQLCARTGARLKVAPVDDRGQIILEAYERLFTDRTRIASITAVSNALGTITPAREMVDIAHRHGACAIVDGAQAVSHMRVDVQALDCDFYVFSGHKVFGPTGIGAVYGKRARLEAMQPWQGGGNMIADVTFEKTVYQPPPFRFEAGTGNIADAVGMGAALDYVMRIGMDVIDDYEHGLLVHATRELARVPGLRMIGTARDKAGVLSFVLDGQRTEDVGAALDKDGIAVRSGHHCAQPILRRFGVEATVRASLAFYNVREDIDALVASLMRLQVARPR